MHDYDRFCPEEAIYSDQNRLLEPELEDLLSNNVVGVLSVTDGSQPYSIPVEYLWHEGAVYFTTGMQGRKLDYVAKHPNVVFLVYESRHDRPGRMIDAGITCRSVIIEGTLSQVRVVEIKDLSHGKRSIQILRVNANRVGTWKCQTQPCRMMLGIGVSKIREWL
jgi:nitroimidazol reductase NimA-like FMN-containing flavoprotein (pyridoxamine 5'-phosphate oxidase superfamily)